MIQGILRRYREPCGYREILNLAIPLILSTGSWSIQQFIDRIFLTWYSADALAAALPSNLVNWTVISVFIGTAGYTNTFVAQYYGARQYNRIGNAVWQGLYLSLSAILLLAVFYPLADNFFRWVNHPPEVQVMETDYFRILLIGSPLAIAGSALSSFFTGRGDSWTVMWVNIVGMVVNVIFDYLMIFGKWIFPEMGIVGAGWASVMGMSTSTLLFFALTALPRHNRQFQTLSGWRYNHALFKRLLRFGLPNGLQFMLEIVAFTIFIILVGKLGVVELAASNLAFNINTLAFLPMYGMTIAVSTLVGQRLGENQPALAEKSTWSAFHLSFIYFFILATGYFLLPDLFLWPFGLQANPVEFEPVARVTRAILKFVAVYSLFDAANMVFSGALKGAGDTRFVAIWSVALSWVLMIIPAWIALSLFQANIYWMWFFATLFIIALAMFLFLRFLKGPWKKMRVIEPEN